MGNINQKLDENTRKILKEQDDLKKKYQYNPYNITDQREKDRYYTNLEKFKKEHDGMNPEEYKEFYEKKKKQEQEEFGRKIEQYKLNKAKKEEEYNFYRRYM